MGLKTDRSIVLQEKEEDGIRRMLQEIEDKVEQTHSHTPGYVSSSCHNGILCHGCHTTHSLTISAQVIHLTPPQKDYWMLITLALL